MIFKNTLIKAADLMRAMGLSKNIAYKILKAIIKKAGKKNKKIITVFDVQHYYDMNLYVLCHTFQHKLKNPDDLKTLTPQDVERMKKIF